MSQHYYYVRICDDKGKEISTRCEKASDPREACRLAFGVIYDNPKAHATYYDIGGRRPADLSQKRKEEIEADKSGWKPIPTK